LLIQFDKVLLEGHQLPTVVLMLASPEEDIVAKASASIYRFAEKCKDICALFYQYIQSSNYCVFTTKVSVACSVDYI